MAGRVRRPPRRAFGATLDGAQHPECGSTSDSEMPSSRRRSTRTIRHCWTLRVPEVRVYPREAVVAEKLHAMVSATASETARFKDFYDLHALAQHFEFDGECLACTPLVQPSSAVAVTITRGCRRLHLTLAVLCRCRSAPSEWAGPTATGASCPGAPSGFCCQWANVSGRSSENRGTAMARRAEFAGTWPAGGPWRR